MNLTLTLTHDHFGSAESGNPGLGHEEAVSKSITLCSHFWPDTLKIDHFHSPVATQLERVTPGQWVQQWQRAAIPVSRASPCLASPPPLFLYDSNKIQADPIHGQHKPSCWPTSKRHSSQTYSASPPYYSVACNHNHSRSPRLIHPPPMGSGLLATWPTFPVANC